MRAIIPVVLGLSTFLSTGAAQQKQVAIANGVFAQFDDGPTVAPDFLFNAGEMVFFSSQLTGYATDANRKMHVGFSIQVLDSESTPLVEAYSDRVTGELSDEDKAWRPKVRHSFQIPSFALSGTYKVVLKLEDALSGSKAEKEFPFQVRGRKVEPSPTLIARNFRFLRSEDDSKPAINALYRQGDTIWARFEITGHRFGPNNRMEVDYGLSVLDASGKPIYSQPVAAADSGSSFYPKRWVSGVLSLTTAKDTAAGEYTLVVTLNDRIGNQTHEERHTFKLQ